METFLADLHIHSRFSRATSKRLNVRLLAAWAAVKGLDVLATGDFTHPEWLAELEEMLVPEGSGLFALKDAKNLSREIPWLGGGALSGRTRFMLCTEISSIYKSLGKVRKIHNLVFMPNLDMVKNFNARLEQVGNLKSDGRPILGLPARDLLEMVLETGPQAFLIPAHIWTPWFSLFGSKSGFDSVEECFGDLSSEIFAMETGLSSDPAMNWLWSKLDRFRMVSNSDAHSGEKLAREANIFSGEMSYEGIYRSLRGEALGHKFLGTIEFFPEEGKYHLDGHRDCNVVMDPHETRSRGGICPVCGKPMTVGVLNRVLALADRETPVQPEGRPGFVSLIPLPEILSEILGTGPNTKKVKTMYARLISRFGSELTVLQDVPPEDLAGVSKVLSEAVSRMRRGEVFREPGFDGRYGKISVFSPKERREIKGGGLLLVPPEGPKVSRPREAPAAAPLEMFPRQRGSAGLLFNEAQTQALDAGPGPVLVLAGPGTGKTQTLIGRVNSLLDKGERARSILAVTFTRRAAGELQKRLVELRGEKQALPRADTLHALAHECWTEAYGEAPVILTEAAAIKVFAEANPGLRAKRLKDLWQRMALSRERMLDVEEHKDLAHAYAKLKESWNLADYTDLLVFWLEQIRSGIYANPYTHVLVDEVQDLSALQLAVVTALVPEGGQGFFAIGDPNQSIYSFRGANVRVRQDLEARWPGLEVVALTENYRSAQCVLDASAPLFPDAPRLEAKLDPPGDIRLFSAPDPAREAAWIGERMRGLLGGTSHSLGDAAGQGELSPGDVAVLVRFKALIRPLKNTLDRFGLPCAVPEAEAFWVEPRVKAILSAAGKFLGIAHASPDDPGGPMVSCPDKVLARGPLGAAAYLHDIPPFDRLFWQGPAFKKLKDAFDEFGGWAGLLNWIHLQTEMDMVRVKAEKIQIMTMHAAKGLEFEAVFLPALEDGIMPFAGIEFLTGRDAALEEELLNEERRLFYVGMTRAKSGLFLSHAARRELYGRGLKLKPSRFLEELPEKYLMRTKMVGRKVRRAKQLGLM
ncbi:MAG: UvrD-helicase domain-containing protein [Thermodesulfobacteriota bacterium]|nr:UvrD-helicase domain-containing protein [Thermodesulfobacteriota bacterium]